MLLPSSQWSEIAKSPREKNYVLVYFPSDKNLAAASQYARNKKMEVIVLNWGLPIRTYKNIRPCSPQEWVGYVKSADAVFTNSYHGLLFSLYFNKPVWVDKRGSRFTSLMDYLDIGNIDLNNDPDLKFKIDYVKVTSLLDNMREKSLDYLKRIGC